MKTRRHFLRHSAAVTVGFLGLDRYLASASPDPTARYGPLLPDPHLIIDLPEGFHYRVLSRAGDKLGGGTRLSGKFDGMAAFPGGDGRIVLVRNHEIGLQHSEFGPFQDNSKLPPKFDVSRCYDPGAPESAPGAGDGLPPYVGGTSNLVFNPKTGKVETQFMSLFGTDRNCAGGPTPWGTWVTCEEPDDTHSERGIRHGYCFEVPPVEKAALVDPIPLRGLGRLRHEAIAVHPSTGIVYLTEDRPDGMLYRFLPKTPGKLQAGGRLQALRFRDRRSADTRNWTEDTHPVNEDGTPSQKKPSPPLPVRERLKVSWVDLDDVESPKDDLRYRGVEDQGAARFSRAEGMWYGSAAQVGEEAIYFACTDGGAKMAGQIFRYFPGTDELEIYLEPDNSDMLQNGDNICIAPWGDLIICEDFTGATAIRGVTPQGEFYTIARNTLNDTELCGCCFSPDGSILFVNIQTPGTTLAIYGLRPQHVPARD